MTDVTRRGFLGACAAALPAARGTPALRSMASGQQVAGPLDHRMVSALAVSVLPTELGPEGIDRVGREFQRWLGAYEAGVETTHGYGTGEIRFTPEHPAPRWASQLASLEAETTRRFGVPFPDADLGRRRAMLRDHLGAADGGLGNPATADHVAVALLAFYYRSPEATDRCYGAAIAKNACRPLDTVSEPPSPLEDAP